MNSYTDERSPPRGSTEGGPGYVTERTLSTVCDRPQMWPSQHEPALEPPLSPHPNRTPLKSTRCDRNAESIFTGGGADPRQKSLYERTATSAPYEGSDGSGQTCASWQTGRPLQTECAALSTPMSGGAPGRTTDIALMESKCRDRGGAYVNSEHRRHGQSYPCIREVGQMVSNTRTLLFGRRMLKTMTVASYTPQSVIRRPSP